MKKLTTLALLATLTATHGAAGETAPPPFTLPNTEVQQLHAAKLNRDYELYISLPKSYGTSSKNYPVVFITDAPYAFPVAASIGGFVSRHSKALPEFIVVGLSYDWPSNGWKSNSAAWMKISAQDILFIVGLRGIFIFWRIEFMQHLDGQGTSAGADTPVMQRQVLPVRHILPPLNSFENLMRFVGVDFKSDEPLILGKEIAEQRRHAREINIEIDDNRLRPINSALMAGNCQWLGHAVLPPIASLAANSIFDDLVLLLDVQTAPGAHGA